MLRNRTLNTVVNLNPATPPDGSERRA